MPDTDLILKNATIWSSDAVTTGDVAIAAGKIAAIGPDLSAAHEQDATGLIATPGGVDPHAHIEQRSGMGLMNADTFETATQSAAMGGTTSVISFAAQG